MPTESTTAPAVCSFPGCGRKREARALCGGHYYQIRQGWDLRPLRSDRDSVAAFHAKVDRSGGPGACWPWTAGRNRRGYGKANLAGRAQTAHRAAWELTNGSIPDGLSVLHHCDNPPCCRADADPLVSHLFLGTHADNMADRSAKSRQASGGRNGAYTKPESVLRGTAHGQAKLTEADVLAIRARAASGETQTVIARDFGIAQQMVGRIANRANWAHLP